MKRQKYRNRGALEDSDAESLQDHFESAILLRLDGKFDQALQQLDFIENLNNNEKNISTISFLRGMINFEIGRYDKAIEAFTKVKGRLKSLPDLNQMIGLSYQHLEDFDKAIKSFSLAITQSGEKKEDTICRVEYPLAVNYYSNRAELYIITKQYSKALSDLNRLIKLDPSGSYGYFKRGELYMAINNYNAAIEDFRMVAIIEAENSKIKRDEVFRSFYDEFSTYLNFYKSFKGDSPFIDIKIPFKVSNRFLMPPRKGRIL